MTRPRPDLPALIAREGETLIAGAVAALGLWVATRGGWFLAAVGAALTVFALFWAASTHRRARFAQPVDSPGVVEVIEGRIGYYGAGTTLGGYAALDDLSEIRLITLGRARYWRLKTVDGQALLIPLGAKGSETLHDAFAALPGADMARIAAAFDGRAAAQSVWTRPGARPARPIALR